MNAANQIFASIIRWAKGEAAIKAMLLVGSRAGEVPPDDLADFDVQLFTKTCTPYTQNDTWLSQIGKVWVSIPEHYYRGEQFIPTRLVIFAEGVKVDFAFYPIDLLAEMVRGDELDMGYEVLLDKDGLTHHRREPTFQNFRQPKPTEQTFVDLVNEFWFEAYHVAKYLKRGELWLVKFRDWGTKELLRQMIEWHEQARHDWDYNTWFMGKQMRSWVGRETWQALGHIFSHFDGEDSWQGLLATVALFRRLATETADLSGFAYPDEVDRNITEFINSCWDRESSTDYSN